MGLFLFGRGGEAGLGGGRAGFRPLFAELSVWVERQVQRVRGLALNSHYYKTKRGKGDFTNPSAQRRVVGREGAVWETVAFE